MILNVNYTEVKKTGANIKEISDEFLNNINQLNSITDNISQIWQGNDAKDYINKFREGCLPGLKKISQIMEKYGEYLCKVPDVYKTLDNNALNKSKQDGKR